MRDKSSAGNSKMFVASINSPEFVGASAEGMAEALLRKEDRGPGDTIDAAAHRLQTRYGVDADIVLQGWRREIKDMKASRWLSLFLAYCKAGLAKGEEFYEQERTLHDENSALVRLADLVAGTQIERKS
jgi:hypothetical protein